MIGLICFGFLFFVEMKLGLLCRNKTLYAGTTVSIETKIGESYQFCKNRNIMQENNF